MTSPISTVDPYNHLHLTLNPDGTLTRHPYLPTVPSSSSLFKDLPLDPSLHTWLRLYLPPNAASLSTLPVILYFHGGGFIILSSDTSIIDSFCSALSHKTSSLVVSVNYRLAPEHRLPAAYDDAESALSWLAGNPNREEWLSRHADLGRVFLLGESAGANIAYRIAHRVASGPARPVKIRGIVLIQPFFGSLGRVGSEVSRVDDPVLPLSVTDMMWELALPEGAGRDHEYCMFRAGSGTGEIGRFKEMGWRVMVTGHEGDPLYDRQVELVKVLEEEGVEVVARFEEGGYHIMEFFEPDKAGDLLVAVNHFMEGCCNSN